MLGALFHVAGFPPDPSAPFRGAPLQTLVVPPSSQLSLSPLHRLAGEGNVLLSAAEKDLHMISVSQKLRLSVTHLR